MYQLVRYDSEEWERTDRDITRRKSKTTQQEREEKEMRADFYQHVYDVVEDALTEALIKLQTENGITDGGCDPLVSHQYDEALEDMAEAVRLVIENQRGGKR